MKAERPPGVAKRKLDLEMIVITMSRPVARSISQRAQLVQQTFFDGAKMVRARTIDWSDSVTMWQSITR